MSLKAMTWAFEQEIGPDLKIVLLALADYANGDGICYPGQQSLARKCSMSERTIRDKIAKLEAMGLIARRRRQDADGYRTSDEYRLLPAGFAGRPTGEDEAPHRQTVAGTEEPSEPSVKKQRAGRMPDGFTWNNAHSLKATARHLDIDHEFEKFTAYHLSKGSTFVDWDKALHYWLSNARPEPGMSQRAVTTRPSRDDEIRDFMSRSLGLDEQKGIEA